MQSLQKTKAKYLAALLVVVVLQWAINLAGFDVLGCNEIDPKMIEAYKAKP
jgi:hypothetical protein